MEYKYYWEDFKVGDRRAIGEIEVSAKMIKEFAIKYDPQPFHIDEEKAKDTVFGGLIASGWHTCSLVMKIMCDSYLLESSSLGSPGVEKIKWIRPVTSNDKIKCYRNILNSRISKSNNKIGIVKFLFETFNQKDEIVMTFESFGMFGRRDLQ